MGELLGRDLTLSRWILERDLRKPHGVAVCTWDIHGIAVEEASFKGEFVLLYIEICVVFVGNYCVYLRGNLPRSLD